MRQFRRRGTLVLIPFPGIETKTIPVLAAAVELVAMMTYIISSILAAGAIMMQLVLNVGFVATFTGDTWLWVRFEPAESRDRIRVRKR